MNVAAVRAECEALCRRVAAADLAGRPVYVVAKSEIFAGYEGSSCYGCTGPLLDLAVRPALGDRWEGRGGAMIIEDESIARDAAGFAARAAPHLRRRRMRAAFREVFAAVSLHELAHLLDGKLYADWPEARAPLAAVSRVYAETFVPTKRKANSGPAATVPFHQHEWGFIRTVLHLVHRAGRCGARVHSADAFDGGCYGLSGVWSYSAALGDEPERMEGQTIAEIRQTRPPERFVNLWRSDYLRWLGATEQTPALSLALSARAPQLFIANGRERFAS